MQDGPVGPVWPSPTSPSRRSRLSTPGRHAYMMPAELNPVQTGMGFLDGRIGRPDPNTGPPLEMMVRSPIPLHRLVVLPQPKTVSL